MQNKRTSQPFKRSRHSLLVEQVYKYTDALERITALRNKSFKRYDHNDGYAEWQRYNELIAVMQAELIALHSVLNKN